MLNSLNIDKKLCLESKELIKQFLELQPEHHKNEFHSCKYSDNELQEIMTNGKYGLEISLFFLGYDIRRRIEFIRQLGRAEINMDDITYKQTAGFYKEYSETVRGTIKTQIKKYFKLQAVYELR